ncbi:hypothetical protein Tco_0186184 [Tanacetum coccineum]
MLNNVTFKVLLHHYGRFTSPPGRKFVDGLVAIVDPVELDNFSTNQVKLILTNSLGYDFNSPTFLYLRNPNCSLDSGLIPLANAIQDRDMLLTYTQTHQNRLHVYVSWVEISPLVLADQRKDERNKKENQGKPSCSKRKIPRRFTNLYYTLPPNNTLSGMKAIKNDYDTNVMYDIAKVFGKLQLFVSHYQIDLSTVLIPNDGSLEESFAANYKLEIYIDHLGVDFIIAKYIFPNASLTEMMNHVITNYTSKSEDSNREVTQNDYTLDQMIEWAEQEHFEDEEIKEVQRRHLKNHMSMASSANEARKIIVSKLQRELEAEATFANQLLCNLTRYREQMRIREIQMTMMQNMPTMSLNSYGLHALLMTHEADIHTTNNLIKARQELLRSIVEKQNFINSYMAI